jgi:hypothetical protein
MPTKPTKPRTAKASQTTKAAKATKDTKATKATKAATTAKAAKLKKVAKTAKVVKAAKVVKGAVKQATKAKAANAKAAKAHKAAQPSKNERDTAARVDRFLAWYPHGPGPGAMFIGLKFEAIGGSVAAQMKQLGVGVPPEVAAEIMGRFNQELAGVGLDADVLFGRLFATASFHLTPEQKQAWVLAMLQIDAERDGLVGDLGKALFESLLDDEARLAVVASLSESHGTVVHQGEVPEFLQVAGLQLSDGRVVALQGPKLAQA